jgi:hypothetical protein
MECSIYVRLLTEFEAATAEYFAATSKLFDVAGNSDGLSFSQGHKIAGLAHDRCRRTHDALNLHRFTHHCSSGDRT